MACDAEAGVESLYKKIQLPEDWVERLTREFEEEIVERQASAGELRVSLTKRLAALAEERQKLLRAFYANAIPLELLKRDQDRITEAEEKARSELAATEADLEKWQEVLTLAIGLAGSCPRSVPKGQPQSASSLQPGCSESRLQVPFGVIGGILFAILILVGGWASNRSSVRPADCP
jgi:hypothetical protein